MYQINFGEPKKVHFIGIGGISMSGLAEILMKEGFAVSGSDAHESPLTRHLTEKGAQVMIGQCAENISDDIDVVVYTAAIHPDNPEFAAVVKKNIPLLSRAELLGQLMKNYKDSIAISGTHGKTSTTSMISEICLAAEKDPTITVGGMLPSIGGNIRIGEKNCFIAEACEYTNSFLEFFPTREIILNVREDHLDFFKDLEDIRNSFHRFALLLPEDGLLVINGEIPDWKGLAEGVKAKVVTYGLAGHEKEGETFTYTAENITYDDMACGSFDVKKNGEFLARFTICVPGEHNVSNALAAIAMTDDMGITLQQIQAGFTHYKGVQRRFEKKGELNGVQIYDDYAHHPDEIRATLTMANKVKKGKLWCIFQPHTYSRTKSLLPEFADALSLADEVIMADIYAARETDTLGVSSENVAELIREKGVKATFIPTFGEIQNFVSANCHEGDLLITMGAGDVVKVGENLLK